MYSTCIYYYTLNHKWKLIIQYTLHVKAHLGPPGLKISFAELSHKMSADFQFGSGKIADNFSRFTSDRVTVWLDTNTLRSDKLLTSISLGSDRILFCFSMQAKSGRVWH